MVDNPYRARTIPAMPAEPAPTERRATVSVRLSRDSHRRLRIVAAEKGVSMGSYLAALWDASPEARAIEKPAKKRH
jgi:hypothetical protein